MLSRGDVVAVHDQALPGHTKREPFTTAESFEKFGTDLPDAGCVDRDVLHLMRGASTRMSPANRETKHLEECV